MKFEDCVSPASSEGEAIEISTDRDRIDTDLVHDYLSRQTDWAAGIPRGTLERSIHNSLVFGAYTSDGRQIGFARAITDYATFAHLADVFVLQDWRRQGLGKRLVVPDRRLDLGLLERGLESRWVPHRCLSPGPRFPAKRAGCLRPRARSAHSGARGHGSGMGQSQHRPDVRTDLVA